MTEVPRVPLDSQRAQALVAEALARATGAAVAPDDVVVDRETPDMVFVGVPGHGQFAGVDLDGATRSALSFVERWLAGGYTSPAEGATVTTATATTAAVVGDPGDPGKWKRGAGPWVQFAS